MIRMIIVDDEIDSAKLLQKRLLRDLQSEDKLTIELVQSVEEAAPRIQVASPPFDIVLADNSLGPGREGLDWLEELRKEHPDIDCILFTDLNESVAERAAEAGIYRYLTQPVEPKELIWCVRSLIKQRVTDFERQWLALVNQIGAKLQLATTIEEISDIIVHGGTELGFNRVEFWRVISGKREPVHFVGYKQAGNCLPRFVGFVMPHRCSEHVRKAYDDLSTKFFDGWMQGRGYVSRKLKVRNSPPQHGEWLCIPLVNDQGCQAVVVLQEPKRSTQLRAEEKKLLDLFAQKASGAWARALLYEYHHIEDKINRVIQRITQETILHGEPEDLGKLLNVLYDEIKQITPTHNFVVAMKHHDPKIDAKGWLRYAFHIKEGTILKPYWRSPSDQGLIRNFIDQNSGPCFCPVGTKRERQRRHLGPPKRFAKGWIATPLSVGGETIGGVFIEEYERQDVWSKEDARLVSAIILRLSHFIQSAWIIEQRTHMAQKRDLLQSANEKIMALAQEQPSHLKTDEWLWHATLTLATAHYGFAFNRAMLFLLDERNFDLYGRMGIGYLTPEETIRAWEALDSISEESADPFDQYIAQLTSFQLRLSSQIYNAVQEMHLPVVDASTAFTEVLKTGKVISVSKQACDGKLPSEFIKTFGKHDYWLLPAKTGKRILGVIVLDAFCETEPPQTHALQYIDTLTNEAAIISQTMMYNRAQEQLASLARETLTFDTTRELGEMLKRIVRTAHLMLRADSVAIYPFMPGIIPLQIECSQIAWYETGDEPAPACTKDLSMYMQYVLNYGDPLAVSAIHDTNNGLCFADDPVVKQKKIKSFIAVPIRGQRTGALRGILYINYHREYTFRQEDIQFAKALANSTAFALRSWREQSGLRIENETREEELRILMQILSHAMRPEVDENSLIDMILRQTRAFLYSYDFNGELSIALFLRGWRRDQNGEPAEIRHQYYVSPKGIARYVKSEELDGLTGLVMKTGKAQRVGDVTKEPAYRPRKIGLHIDYSNSKTRSELDVPVIDEDGYPVGVLNVESSEPYYFTETHEKMLVRLCRVAMVALDTVRRRQFTDSLFAASKAITSPTEINITLGNIIRQARHLLPNLSLLTIWRIDSRSDQLVLAVYDGLRSRIKQEREEPRDDGAIEFVMHSSSPLWVEDVSEHTVFNGSDFVRREAVKSTVAFPLVVEDEPVGAIFFSYRQHHRFSKMEREMLPILAMFVAIGIHDADAIQAKERERQRLTASLEITEAVGATPDLSHIFAQARATLKQLYRDATVVILQFNRQRRQLMFVKDENHINEIDNFDYKYQDSLELDEQAMVSALAKESLQSREQQTRLIKDLHESSAQPYLHLRDNARTSIGATIMDTSGELLGALVMEGDEPNIYKEDDRILVAAIATQIGIAIDRSVQIAAIDFRNVLTDSMIWAADLSHELNREIYQMRTWLAVLTEEETYSELGNQAIAELNDSFNRIAAEVPWTEQNPVIIDDLAALLRNWVTEYIGEHANTVDLLVRTSAQPITLYTKPGVLKRIIRHLVSNGLRAMRHTGTIILRVHKTNDDHNIQIQLEDSGPGIPMDDPLRGSLFAQRIVNQRTKGGLGLLFVRLLVEQLGGRIQLLDYTEQHGACFCLYLPHILGEEEVNIVEAVR